jgi:hypothetical protein
LVKEDIYIKQMLTGMHIQRRRRFSATWGRFLLDSNRRNLLREEAPMKKNPNEKANKLTGSEPKKEFVWKLTEEDKEFLRSINVSPN